MTTEQCDTIDEVPYIREPMNILSFFDNVDDSWIPKASFIVVWSDRVVVGLNIEGECVSVWTEPSGECELVKRDRFGAGVVVALKIPLA